MISVILFDLCRTLHFIPVAFFPDITKSLRASALARLPRLPRASPFARRSPAFPLRTGLVFLRVLWSGLRHPSLCGLLSFSACPLRVPPNGPRQGWAPEPAWLGRGASLATLPGIGSLWHSVS